MDRSWTFGQPTHGQQPLRDLPGGGDVPSELLGTLRVDADRSLYWHKFYDVSELSKQLQLITAWQHEDLTVVQGALAAPQRRVWGDLVARCLVGVDFWRCRTSIRPERLPKSGAEAILTSCCSV